MRSVVANILEQGRVRDGRYRSDTEDGLTGAFLVRSPTGNALRVISSGPQGWREAGLPGDPWEHVSVSIIDRNDRCPTWPDMCWVKSLFFEDEELVLQFHPPASRYVKSTALVVGRNGVRERAPGHAGVLHLWRPTGQEIELPPIECV